MQFKLALLSLLSVAAISLTTAVSISAQPDLNPQQEQIVTTCLETCEIAVRGLAGLAASRKRKDDDNDRSA